MSRTRRGTGTRKNNPKGNGRTHGRLNPRTTKEANHASNRAHSSRGKEGKNRKRLTKEIHKINSPRSQSHEYWPWHVHIRSYKSDIPIECSGMLLERILNLTQTSEFSRETRAPCFRSEVIFLYLFSGIELGQVKSLVKSSRIVITSAHCFKTFDFEHSDVSDTIDIEHGIYLYAGFNNRTQLKTWIGTY